MASGPHNLVVTTMDKLPEIHMIKVSLNLFQLVGETSNRASLKLICFRVITTGAIVLALWYILQNFFVVQADLYVQTLHSSLLVLHLLIKYVSFLKYKYNITEILYDIAHRFWKHQFYDKEVSEKTEKIYRAIEKTQLIMVVLATLGTMTYFMKPFFAVNQGLLFYSFIPISNVTAALVLVSQFLCFYTGCPLVIGYDICYFAVCTHVVLQLQLLKQHMKNMINGYDFEIEAEIGRCIRQHQFLFGMYLRMQYIYSVMLLFHYLVTLLTTCILLLDLFIRRSIDINTFVSITTVLVFVAQFALYAFPAEQIANEFTKISEGIYASNWYERSVKNQKTLLFIMMVAHRIRYFTGAGLVDINVDTFHSVFRKSFSFCAIFKNIMEK